MHIRPYFQIKIVPTMLALEMSPFLLDCAQKDMFENMRDLGWI